MYEVMVKKQFSSAHFLRRYHGHDEPLHGHTWKAQVKFSGKKLTQPEEVLVDFVEVQKSLETILARIDYKNMNEIPPFDRINPSAENVARWLYEELLKTRPDFSPSCVTIWETSHCAASYSPD